MWTAENLPSKFSMDVYGRPHIVEVNDLGLCNISGAEAGTASSGFCWPVAEVIEKLNTPESWKFTKSLVEFYCSECSNARQDHNDYLCHPCRERMYAKS